MYSLLPFHLTQPKQSIYVISDSEWNEYKRQQSLAEIAELNKLIAGHQQSIERLKETRTLMEQQFTEEKQAEVTE